MEKQYGSSTPSRPAAKPKRCGGIKTFMYFIQLAATLSVSIGAWFLLRAVYIWNDAYSDLQMVIARSYHEPVGWLIVGVVLGVPALLVALLAKALLAPLQVGICRTHLKIAAGETVRIADVFSGFRKGYWQAFSLAFSKHAILFFLHLLPLLGDLISCAVIFENLGDSPAAMTFALRFSGAVWLALEALCWIWTLSYSLTHFVLSESPKMDARSTLSESADLLRGHKREAFVHNIGCIAAVILVTAALGTLAYGLWHYLIRPAAEYSWVYMEISDSLVALPPWCRLFDLRFPIAYPFLLIVLVVEQACTLVCPFFLTRQAALYRRLRDNAPGATRPTEE